MPCVALVKSGSECKLHAVHRQLRDVISNLKLSDGLNSVLLSYRDCHSH